MAATDLLATRLLGVLGFDDAALASPALRPLFEPPPAAEPGAPSATHLEQDRPVLRELAGLIGRAGTAAGEDPMLSLSAALSRAFHRPTRVPGYDQRELLVASLQVMCEDAGQPFPGLPDGMMLVSSGTPGHRPMPDVLDHQAMRQVLQAHRVWRERTQDGWRLEALPTRARAGVGFSLRQLGVRQAGAVPDNVLLAEVLVAPDTLDAGLTVHDDALGDDARRGLGVLADVLVQSVTAQRTPCAQAWLDHLTSSFVQVLSQQYSLAWLLGEQALSALCRQARDDGDARLADTLEALRAGWEGPPGQVVAMARALVASP